MRRVLSRNHPEVDEGWLCDRGRFALRARARRRPLPAAALVRGAARARRRRRASSSPRRSRARLRHHASLHGPDSIAVVASGEQSNEEAFAWAELVRAAGGGALVRRGSAGAGWERSRRTRARIADLDRADVIVVAGERELGDAAGVLELRVRQAVRRGARLLLAGSGGGDLDLVAAGRIAAGRGRRRAARPPTRARADRDRPGRRRGRRRDGARRAASADGPGGVLAVPEGPNERGLRALGYRDDAADRAARAPRTATLQMLIVLGDADALSRFPEPERWEAALQRCESVVASSLFPTPTALWAHVILPATSALEKDGTIDEPRGPHAAPAAVRCRRRRASRPSSRCSPPPARHLELELDASPSRAFARVAAAAPLFAGLTLGVDRPARPAAPPARPKAGAAPRAAAPPPPRRAATACTPIGRRPLFSGAAVERTERLALPAQRRDRARARRRRAARHRRGRSA